MLDLMMQKMYIFKGKVNNALIKTKPIKIDESILFSK